MPTYHLLPAHQAVGARYFVLATCQWLEILSHFLRSSLMAEQNSLDGEIPPLSYADGSEHCVPHGALHGAV